MVTDDVFVGTTGNLGAPQRAAATGNTVSNSHPVDGGSPDGASPFAASNDTTRSSIPPSVDYTPGGSVRERVANYQSGN